ncbi:ribonuclease toxin immunity protein CdiI [Vibrio quintilis]|uniref:ribonuclease toxin immunity protein CdiI n=1 Tax=Vibrio quintilis TaxID=1117707 RepID=UPI001F411AB2|nr:ribonuclease toxin immunity protein CdiI [Vibrio quintilis]
MNDILYQIVDCENDPLWIAKEFFNSINGPFFVRAIRYLVNGISYGDEYFSCDFPDELDEDEEYFDGVKFRYHDDELVMSVNDFKEYLVIACKRFKELHPDQSCEIDKVLSDL